MLFGRHQPYRWSLRFLGLPSFRCRRQRAGGELLAALMGFLLLQALPARAINASPDPITLQQPDGTRITLRVRGDEHHYWHEDLQGYTVARDHGRYVYARLSDRGLLIPTALAVGAADPHSAGLVPGLAPAQPAGNTIRPVGKARLASGPGRISARGQVRNLVVLCKFNDHALELHTRSAADYDILFNHSGPHTQLAPTGSVRDYFEEASYGLLNLTSTVVGWVTLPHSEAYYANGSSGLEGAFPETPQGMVRDALDLVDPLVNFADFDADNDGFIDAITIIHSGYGAETGGGRGNWIWSHRSTLWQAPFGRWTSADRNQSGINVKVFDYHTEPALWSSAGSDITRIGVICHETGHFFGLPDLYDGDGGGEGIGSYCLMANAWGFDRTQLHPPHPSAWAKIKLGWVSPTPLTPGAHDLPQIETIPTVFQVTGGYPGGEYLLIENRQPVGFESDLPQGGLAIWHIDDNQTDNNGEGYPDQAGWPGNNNHYAVALLQADGRYDLERGNNRGDSGDLYHGGGVDTIGPETTPNTRAYRNGKEMLNRVSAIGLSGPVMSLTYAVEAPARTPLAPYITNYSAGILRADFTGWVGFQFTVGPKPISVQRLARLCHSGNTQSHQVKLVSALTGRDVPGGMVQINLAGAAPGEWSFQELAASIELQPHESYYLLGSEVLGGDRWFDLNASVQTWPVASCDGPVWGVANNWNVVSGHSNQSYGLLNLDFTTRAEEPPPAPVLFIGSEDDTVIITWRAIAGLPYTLQYKNNLTDESWIDLTGALTFQSDAASWSNSTARSARRFYRAAVGEAP